MPFKDSPRVLQKYCMPMAFFNEHSVFDISPVGSSFRFRHCGRNFVLFSRHQLGIGAGARQPSDAALVIREGLGHVGLTPDETISAYPPDTDKIFHDFMLLRYASNRENRFVDDHFLEVDWETNPDLGTYRDVLAIFAIGYLTENTDYSPEFDEDGGPTGLEIVSRWTRLYLERREATSFDIEGRLPLRVHSRQLSAIGDPDGLSGSPVFFIYRDEALQTHLGFAGIITDANISGDVNVYEAENIKNALDQIT